MQWTRQRRTREGSQGGFAVSVFLSVQTNGADADGEVVWS
jgi:hypothetical protein